MRNISRLSFVLALSAAFFAPHQAHAIPSFTAQTGQPCSACHVGAFGPQLKPYGRDFKLGGYVASDRSDDNIVDNWYERITAAAKTSFTHNGPIGNSKGDILPNAGGKGFRANDNLAFDQGMVFFGGRITQNVGALAEVSYDGINQNFFWDAVDIRRAWDGELFGQDFTAGINLDNQMANSTIWNSTAPWAFPYNSSSLSSTPQAGTLLEDALNGQIIGPGAYFSNGLVFGEANVYFPLNRNFNQAMGTGNTASDKYVAPIPYGHLAIEHEFDHHSHYAQAGMFGTTATRQPGNDQTTGHTDRITDFGLEGNYQYLADMHNAVSAHATFVHENQELKASQALSGTNATNHLNQFKADVTYSIDDTYVPSVQYFKTTGSSDTALYTSSANGSPNSEGYTVDLAYVPFGKPDSSIQWGNARLALQYTGYTRFNGTSKNASDNNTLFLNLWVSLAPLVPAFGGDK